MNSSSYQSDKQVLKNAFPKWAEGEGIFSEMTGMPWVDEVDGVTLDMEYFGNRSGLKFCSPLVYNFLDKDGAVTSNGRAAIARVLKSRFLKPWTRLWQTYTAQYDPLENYDMTEQENRNRSGENQYNDNGTDNQTFKSNLTGSGNDTTTRTGTVNSTRTDDLTDTNKTNTSTDQTVKNQRNGFNSASAVDTGNTATDSKVTGNDTLTHKGTVQDTTENDLTDGTTRSNTEDTSGNRDTTRSLTHSGTNIEEEITERRTHGFSGRFLSYQRLLSEEREVWMWDYFDKVFKDVDRVLTLAIFDPCRVQSTGLYSGGAAKQYVLPVANNTNLGGVRGPAKTNGIVPVQIDGSGRMFVPQYPAEYNLPIASQNILGGVKAAPKTNALIPVQVDSDGTLYVPEGGITAIPVATSEEIGGIKFPAEPTGDGEEISTKNGVQYKVDASLNPDGGMANDDTASVVIPFAGTTAGLVKAKQKTNEATEVAVDSVGKLWVPTLSRQLIEEPVTLFPTPSGSNIDGYYCTYHTNLSEDNWKGMVGKTIRIKIDGYDQNYLADVDKFADYGYGGGYYCNNIRLIPDLLTTLLPHGVPRIVSFGFSTGYEFVNVTLEAAFEIMTIYTSNTNFATIEPLWTSGYTPYMLISVDSGYYLTTNTGKIIVYPENARYERFNVTINGKVLKYEGVPKSS